MLRCFVPMVLALAAFDGQTAAAPVASPHATTELVAAQTSVAPGGRLQAALVQTFDAGWHSYWRNPGDAGEAATVSWTLPPGWKAEPLQWPTPKRLPVGPIMNYGYEGRLVLPVVLDVPATAKAGESASLRAQVQFLVCAEVCVPDQVEVTLTVPVTATAGASDPRWSGPISQSLAALPKAGVIEAAWQRRGSGVTLALAGAPLAGSADRDAYAYPYDDKLIDHAAAQLIERGPRGLTLTLKPVGDFAKAGASPVLAGVLVVDGKAYAFDAKQGSAPPGSAGMGAPTEAGAASGLGLAAAIAFAFVGGLILNLMPCVFPILSMKAASLAGHSGEGSGARREALAFLAGVVGSFLALALALVLARAGGQAVGWGFQLQSPVIVAALALIMLASGLNLSGVFEIGTSVQGVGAQLASRGGLIGAAATGVLAVVVAAPCTAPFMGPALGFALVQPPAACFAVFLALALGFAAPFVIVSFSPFLLKRLPRPGAWMETFRRALAFPMYAAAAWLLWVLAQQTDSEGLARALAAAVLAALALWLFGAAQQRRSLKGRAPAHTGLAAAAILAAIGIGFIPPFAPHATAGASAGAIAGEPWSEDKVAALTASGRPVFVNFTAAWCVTCQVNERGAFSSGQVRQAFHKTGAAYLIGDWTNRDGAIAKALAAQGRVGVPLYLVYPKGGGAPQVLPQILTPGVVTAALDRANAGG